MKTRRMVITVEVESNEPIGNLKTAIADMLNFNSHWLKTIIKRVQVNVIKKEK